MWCLTGRFDPETGVRLHGRLEAALSELFADHVPDGCPSDPCEKQDHLRAQALVALLDGQVRGVGRPEITVVVDVTQTELTGTPVVDWGIPVEVPLAVLQDLAGTADVHPVLVAGGIVWHAPGVLNLGRTSRIANRAQRRALTRAVRDVCHPGLRREVRPLQTASRRVVGQRTGRRTSAICSHFVNVITTASTTRDG